MNPARPVRSGRVIAFGRPSLRVFWDLLGFGIGGDGGKVSGSTRAVGAVDFGVVDANLSCGILCGGGWLRR